MTFDDENTFTHEPAMRINLPQNMPSDWELLLKSNTDEPPPDKVRHQFSLFLVTFTCSIAFVFTQFLTCVDMHAFELVTN